MDKTTETITHTVETPTGQALRVPVIQPVTNVAITPTQPETVGQKMAGQLGLAFGVAAVTYLTAHAMQHYLTGVSIIAFMVLPLELTRRVLAIVQTRVGTTTAMAAGAAAVAAASKVHSALGFGLAMMVGFSACLAGCPVYTRPECEHPGRYQCEHNTPRFCSLSGRLTNIGDLPCGDAQHCTLDAHGTAFCAPGAP